MITVKVRALTDKEWDTRAWDGDAQENFESSNFQGFILPEEVVSQLRCLKYCPLHTVTTVTEERQLIVKSAVTFLEELSGKTALSPSGLINGFF